MENPELWSLLFAKKLEDGTFLFQNQAQLATKIEEFTQGERSARSVASSLSAFFRGERMLPAELETMISTLIEGRVGASHQCISEFRSLVASANLRVTNRRKQVRAQHAVPDVIQKVKEFFSQVKSPRALVIVEYRDLPRSAPQAKYMGLAKSIAEAIAGGLSFAMFQPFGSDSPHLSGSSRASPAKRAITFRHTTIVEDYCNLIRERVRKAYSYVLGEAIALAPTMEADLRKRVVLFERNSAYPSSFLSGIQSRIVFTIYPKGNFPEAPITRQVFEWVAGKEDDYFIEREDNENFVKVVGEQFFPVVAHWSEAFELPHTQALLGHAIAKSNSDKEFAAEIPEDAWLVYNAADAASS
jgi:hypothetical protein